MLIIEQKWKQIFFFFKLTSTSKERKYRSMCSQVKASLLSLADNRERLKNKRTKNILILHLLTEKKSQLGALWCRSQFNTNTRLLANF